MTEVKLKAKFSEEQNGLSVILHHMLQMALWRNGVKMIILGNSVRFAWGYLGTAYLSKKRSPVFEVFFSHSSTMASSVVVGHDINQQPFWVICAITRVDIFICVCVDDFNPDTHWIAPSQPSHTLKKNYPSIFSYFSLVWWVVLTGGIAP